LPESGCLRSPGIYDSRRNRCLVAAIEILSPSTRTRPENRATFFAKVATLLKNNICVVDSSDVVSTYDFNLYAELMNFLQGVLIPRWVSNPPPMYAATHFACATKIAAA